MASWTDPPPAASAALDDRPSSRFLPAFDASARDRLAARILRGPLAWTLCTLGLIQLATWIPHYLTWPFWADHDAFATMARGWSLGQLPYRDLRCNNFPGTVYLFWILGTLFGWGRSLPFYAVDATLVVILGVALLAWSRQRLGGILPGLVGYLTFLSYYLSLDYTLTAQRDSQGPILAALGVLAAQSWSGRTGRLASALVLAVAVTIRPQTVLFLPAVALALDEAARQPGEPPSRTLRPLLEWAVAFGVLVALMFLPLVAAGVASDFVNGVRLAAYGGQYNRVTVASFVKNWIQQVEPLRVLLLPAAIVLLAPLGGLATRRTVLTWGAALAAVSLYKPLSPVPHHYLDTPLWLVWSINLALLVHLLLAARWATPSLQLVAILLAVSLGISARPNFCLLGSTRRALASLSGGRGGDDTPPAGYRHGPVPTAAFYAWPDYRSTLDYLRRATGPETRVANALKGSPAIVAPTNRRSAFPVESVAWLFMVRPDDEAAFAEALEAPRDTVVVWAPGEVGPDPKFTTPKLDDAITRHYHPEARFGAIEVWRRTMP